MATVVVRYFASARAIAGVAEDTWHGDDVAQILGQVTDQYGERMGAIIAASSVLLGGVYLHDRTAVLPETAELEILPPFAGG